MSDFVEIAAKLVADWKAIGFKDIRFLECRPCDLMSVQDFIDDGKTADDHARFCRDHAGIVAIPDTPLILPYEFGESTLIEHNQHTGEWYMNREFP